MSSVNGDEVSLQWQPSNPRLCDGGVDHYTVQYSLVGGNTTSRNVTGTSIILSNLETGSTYTIVVFAVNRIGPSLPTSVNIPSVWVYVALSVWTCDNCNLIFCVHCTHTHTRTHAHTHTHTHIHTHTHTHTHTVSSLTPPGISITVIVQGVIAGGFILALILAIIFGLGIFGAWKLWYECRLFAANDEIYVVFSACTSIQHMCVYLQYTPSIYHAHTVQEQQKIYIIFICKCTIHNIILKYTVWYRH